MTAQKGPLRSERYPVWVPDAARNYLAHTQKGLSIRAVARENACHPSTVLRQIRRFEGRRDDTSSLGDWSADHQRFPSGIPALAAKVKKRGLKFGLWMEPEMAKAKGATPNSVGSMPKNR